MPEAVESLRQLSNLPSIRMPPMKTVWPSTAFFTNYSWHWDGGEPAGNPLSFVIRGPGAAVPLQANEAELLTEAILQYGNVPEGAVVTS